MSAPLLMIAASFLFATMSVCVKLASAEYGTGEIVFYRGLIGAILILAVARSRGGSVRTQVPAMHLWRGVVGVSAMMLWFYAISQLPVATAITLNYMSSVWMAMFLIGGAILLGSSSVDGRLVVTVLTGFVGVALVLKPTMQRDQFQGALAGLMSGMLAAMAYLQVTALGRVGEPEYRVVFYFSITSMVAGAFLTWVNGIHAHSLRGAALLLAIGVLATVAQTMMTRAYAIGRALSNASLQYLGIAYSYVYGVLLFHDPATPSALAGMMLIVGAGLVATRLRQQVTADAVTGSGES